MNYQFLKLLGIISSVNIAGVVREGKFAGHMINNETELVFMDEWTSDSLSCEDAKRILQGITTLLIIYIIIKKKFSFRIFIIYL